MNTILCKVHQMLCLVFVEFLFKYVDRTALRLRSCPGTSLTCSSSCTSLGPKKKIKDTSPQMLCWWLWKVTNLWNCVHFTLNLSAGEQLGLRDAGQFSELTSTLSHSSKVHNINQHQLQQKQFIGFLVHFTYKGVRVHGKKQSFIARNLRNAE